MARLSSSPVRSILSTNVVMAGMTFLVSVTQARALDPAGRGMLAIFILWPSVVATLSLMGVHLYLAREAGRDPVNIRRHYRSGYIAVGTCCGFASVIWLLIGLLTPVLGQDVDAGVVVLTAIIIPLSAWNAMQVQIELGRGSFTTYNLARIAFTVTYFVLIAASIAAGFRSAAAFLVAFAAAAAIAAISAQVVIGRSISGVPDGPAGTAPPTWAQIRSGSFPYAVSTALLAVSAMVDRMVVSVFFDARAMGIYVVAITMSQLQSVINEAISPLFFARSGKVSMVSMDREWLSLRLRQTVIINMIISLFLVSSAPLLIPLIFGEDYSDALLVALLLIPAVGFRSMMRPFEEVLKGSGQANSQSLALLTMLGVFLAVTFGAAPYGGILAVAAGMICASLTGLLIVSGILSRMLSIDVSALLVPRRRDLLALRADLWRLVKI